MLINKINHLKTEANKSLSKTIRIRNPLRTSELKVIKELFTKNWGLNLVSVYFCEYGNSLENNHMVYKNIINTFHFRSALFEEKFCNPPQSIGSTDKMFVNGKFNGLMIIAPLNIISRYKYRINPFTLKMGFVGGAKSFFAIPVYDNEGAKIIGSINVGLADKASKVPLYKSQKNQETLIRDIIECLEKTIPNEIEIIPTINQNIVKSIVNNIDRIPATLLSLRFSKAFKEIIMQLEKIEHDLEQNYLGSLSTLAFATETRERYTGRHCFSVMRIATEIAKKLPDDIWFEGIQQNKASIAEERKRLLPIAALIHDVGKIGIKDDILIKEGRLDSSEYEEIKKHTVKGSDLLSQLPKDNPLRTYAMESAIAHHEDYDGGGYPKGKEMQGNNIPLIGRIVRVADSYHAMTSKRSYRNARTGIEALSEIVRGISTLYDPRIVKAFLQIATEDLLPKEDMLIKALQELKIKFNNNDDIISASIVETYIQALNEGVSYNDIYTNIEKKGFKQAFKEAFDVVDKEMSETSIRASKYLSFIKLLEKYVKVYLIISDFTKNKEFYSREIITQFISILSDIWLGKSELSANEAIRDCIKVIEEMRRNFANEEARKAKFDVFIKLLKENLLLNQESCP